MQLGSLGHLSSPSRSGRSQAARWVLVYFQLKRALVMNIVRRTIIMCSKKSQIITVNRLVHYGQSQQYYSQYWLYGQAISGPDIFYSIHRMGYHQWNLLRLLKRISLQAGCPSSYPTECWCSKGTHFIFSRDVNFGFSKNRLSFWKNWFFFDYRIWASLIVGRSKTCWDAVTDTGTVVACPPGVALPLATAATAGNNPGSRIGQVLHILVIA